MFSDFIHFFFPDGYIIPFVINLQKSDELTFKEVDNKIITLFPLNYWIALLN